MARREEEAPEGPRPSSRIGQRLSKVAATPEGGSLRRLASRALGAGARGLASAARRAYASPHARRALSLAILAGAVLTASVAVRAGVEGDRRYRVSKASLSATAPPPGLARGAIDTLAELPIEGRSFSLYRPDAIEMIATTYARLPWVREVRKIEKHFPAIVRFDLVVRRPIAGLVHKGTSFLVDGEGVVLPRRCFEPSDPSELGLPLILHAKLGRRRVREGDRLEDLPVRHGLSVAQALQSEAFAPLRAVPISIDVSNVNFEVALNRPEVVVMAGGTVIEWGRAEAAAGLNLPLTEKIANFAEAVKGRPLERLSLVRLQFDQVEWRERPLVGAPSAGGATIE